MGRNGNKGLCLVVVGSARWGGSLSAVQSAVQSGQIGFASARFPNLAALPAFRDDGYHEEKPESAERISHSQFLSLIRDGRR